MSSDFPCRYVRKIICRQQRQRLLTNLVQCEDACQCRLLVSTTCSLQKVLPVAPASSPKLHTKKSELKKKIQVDFGNQTKMLRQKRRASFNWLVLSSQISTFQTLMKFADSFLAQPSISFLLLLFVACLVLHHYSLARGYNKLHCQRMSGLVTS
jgi:hypothetical protein